MKPDKAQTLNRAVQILDCFTPERPDMGVREMARLLDMSTSATGRIMLAMKELGILIQNPVSKTYSVGARPLAWAGIYLATNDIRIIAMPYMEDLHRTTQETISLYILDGYERVCIERLESPQNVRIVARIGRRMPLYAGSAGKAFLAFMPGDQREEILKSVEMKAITANTIIDKDELRAELKKIRAEGCAVSHGEWTLEASGVAAPIFGQKEEVIAVITISGPTQRFQDEMIREHCILITRVAQQISAAMGSRLRTK